MNDISKSNLVEEKAALRKLADVRRARVHNEFAAEGRRLLSHRTGDIIEQCALGAGAVIAGYHPIKDEMDCLELLAALRAHGFKIALPKMREHEKALDFYEWTVTTPLLEGVYGVMEPAPEPDAQLARVTPDLIILPLLAFDLNGGRLGYGGGYYDRTLGALRGQGKVIAVGIGYDEQEFDDVPRDGHDQLLDFVATPKRFIKVPQILS